jgi:hypothetical protein
MIGFAKLEKGFWDFEERFNRGVFAIGAGSVL